MLEILRSPEVVVAGVMGGIAAIVWGVRLEGLLRQEKAMRSVQVASLRTEIERQGVDITRVRERQDAADHRVARDLEAIKIQLAELNGFLKHIFKQD